MYICVIVSTVDVNDCIFCANEQQKVYMFIFTWFHVHQGHTRKFKKRRSQRQRQCHKSTIGKYNRASRAARTLAYFVAHYASVMTLNN